MLLVLANAQALQCALSAELMNADLGSSTRSHEVEVRQAVPINVGGERQLIQNGQATTAAESIAVQQVLRTGRQSLAIGQSGQAIGGVVNLRTDIHTDMSNLVIPRGVTAVRDFAGSGIFNLSGALTNAGTFFAYSTNPTFNTAAINATTITNLQGALFTTTRPSGLTGIPLGISNLNLSLNASRIVNYGSVTGPGSISFNAPSIINAGSQTESPAVIQAARDINLITNNLINNHALISSLTANVNITASTPGQMSIHNVDGKIEARHGAIDISDAITDCTAKLRVIGGDFDSRQLNIDAGNGYVEASVNDVSGVVNIAAGNSVFGASSPVLTLGDLRITGDPTYFNTEGSLVMSGTGTLGADLALIAKGNVIVDGGSISAPNITIIAGADVTSDGAAGATGDSTTTLTINPSANPGGGSVTGGSISLRNTSVSTTGDLTLIAFDGTGEGSGLAPGRIDVQTGPLLVGGDLLVIAGSTRGGNTISLPVLGQIPTVQSTPVFAIGNASIYTAKPVVNGPLLIRDGSILSGSVSPDSSLTNGSLYVASASYKNPEGFTGQLSVALQAGKTLTVRAGQDINFTGMIDTHVNSGLVANSGSVNLYAGHDVLATGIDARGIGSPAGSLVQYGGGNVAINAGNDVLLTRAIATDGGSFSSSLATPGAAGNVTVSAGDELTVNQYISASGGKAVNRDGTAGAVSLIATKVRILSSMGSTGSSILTNGKNGSVSINLINAPLSQTLQDSADFSSSTATVPVRFETTFRIGGTGVDSYVAGSIKSSQVGGSVVVNGQSQTLSSSGQVSSTNLTVATAGAVSASFNGEPSSVFTEQSLVTPAQWIALVQQATGGQTMVLNNDGQAVGGTITLTDANMLTKQGQQITLDRLTVPADVTVTYEGGSPLILADSVAVDGVLLLSGNASVAAHLIKTPSLLVNGTLTVDGARALQIQSTEAQSTLHVTFGSDAVVRTTDGDISFNPLTPGEISFDSQGLGRLDAGGDQSRIWFRGGLNNVTANLGEISGIVTGAGSSFTVSTGAGGMSVGQVTASQGPVLLSVASGQMHVVPESRITAVGGELTLLNMDEVAGTILLDQNVTLRTSATAINLIVGNNKSINPTSAPGGVHVVEKNGNSLVIDEPGITVVGPSVFLTAGNADITFANLSDRSDAITLAGFNKVNTSTAAIITSLDLSRITTVAALRSFQSQGLLGGELTTNQNGIITGGTLVINDDAIFLNLNNIIDVPENVRVQFIGLQRNNPIEVNPTLGQASMTVDGSVEFQANSNVSSNPVINLFGKNAVVRINGHMVSDGSITVRSEGSIFVAGLMRADSAISLLCPSVLNGGSVQINGGVFATGTDSKIYIDSKHGIASQDTGIISARSIELASSNGAIGTSSPVYTSSQFLTARAGTTIYIDSSSSVQLSDLRGSQVAVRSEGSIFVAGTIESATTASLRAENGSVVFVGDTSAGSLSIYAAEGWVIAEQDVQINGGARLYAQAKTIINPAAFSFNQVEFDLVADDRTNLVTLANPFGDLVLTPSMLVNTSGKNLQIIAQGNVKGSGIATINTATATGNGGYISIIAGVDSTFVDESNVLAINPGPRAMFSGPSAGGGSIDLPTILINTSSFSSSGSAGSISFIAHAGSDNAGSISLGSIIAISNAGGNSVSLVAPGGVTIRGAVNLSGTNGAGRLSIGAGMDNYQYSGGLVNGGGTRSTNASAGVLIQGPITTSSSMGTGGSVSMKSSGQIALRAPITTTGRQMSGSVSLTSVYGAISVLGSINTSTPSIVTSPELFVGGLGGLISLQAPESIHITGSLITAGGNAMGIGIGGWGAPVIISTGFSSTELQHVRRGNVFVGGFINTSGGTATMLTEAGFGGNGGYIDIRTGSMQVMSSFAGASILTTGGKAWESGSAGTVYISTSAIQAVPKNFNLQSNFASEYALPGGLFAIGAQPVVNGTAAAIIGSQTLFNANVIQGQPIVRESISISTSGFQSISLLEGNGTRVILPGSTNNTRTKVTPAEAAALYQISNGEMQQLGLTATGIASGLNPQEPLSSSQLNIVAQHLPQEFSNFVMGTATANPLRLLIVGSQPVLNLATASLIGIRGSIEFATDNGRATILSAQPFVIANGASVSADNELLLVMPVISNNGTLTAHGQIILSNGPSAITLQQSLTGAIDTPFITLSLNTRPAVFSMTSNRGNIGALATRLQSVALYNSADFVFPAHSLSQNKSILLNYTLLSPTGQSQAAKITGSANASYPLTNITISGNWNSTPQGLIGTPIFIADGAELIASNLLNINSTGTIEAGSATIGGPTVLLTARGMTYSGSTLLASTALTINNLNQPTAPGELFFRASTTVAARNLNLMSQGNILAEETLFAAETARITSPSQYMDNATTFEIENTLSIIASGVSLGGVDRETNVYAVNGVTLIGTRVAEQGLGVGTSANIQVDKGAIVIRAGAIAGIGGKLSAGIPATADLPSKLLNSDILSSGSISITGFAVALSQNAILETFGTTASPGNITITGTREVQLANASLTANGGNIVINTLMASPYGSIRSSGGAELTANGVAVNSNPGAFNVGGGIEIAATLAPGRLAGAALQPPGTVPSDPKILGNNVSIHNQSITQPGRTGVVQAIKVGSATIDLGSPSDLRLSGGVIVISSGSRIGLNGVKLNVSGYKAISYVSTATERARSGSHAVARLFDPETRKFTNVETDGDCKNKILRISDLEGNTILAAEADILLDSHYGQIQIQKGALVTLEEQSGFLRVIALSGPGHVVAMSGERQLQLNPGEELIISKSPNSFGSLGDRIARRAVTNRQLASGLYVSMSDVSIPSLLRNGILFKNLSYHEMNESVVLRRLLKTAAALEQVTKYRGSYSCL